jgi:hypothetical protein
MRKLFIAASAALLLAAPAYAGSSGVDANSGSAAFQGISVVSVSTPGKFSSASAFGNANASNFSSASSFQNGLNNSINTNSFTQVGGFGSTNSQGNAGAALSNEGSANGFAFGSGSQFDFFEPVSPPPPPPAPGGKG